MNESNKKRRRRKRKKLVYECPNPLFEKWLIEWKEEAIAKGWKTQHTYSKALLSLQKYPLPLQSGKEAKYLEHFGEKLSKMLDDKLKEYNRTSAHSLSDMASTSADNYTSILPKANERNDAAIAITAATSEQLKKTLKPRNSSNNKKYVPAPRTGGYALLITLLKFENDEGRKSVFKQELIDSAQSLCDTSFTRPEPGCYYTAWSMMGTLIQKGLVIKRGCPARYNLSDAGHDLAISLMVTDKNLEDNNLVETDSHIIAAPSKKARTYKKKSNNKTTRLKYKYVDINGQETMDSKKALQIKDDSTGFTGFLIKCNKNELYSSSERFKIDNTRITNGEEVYAYLHKENIDICPSLENIEHEQILFVNANDDSVKTFKNCELHDENDRLILYPGSFDIVLCIDNCEVCTSDTRNHRAAVLSELNKLGVNYDVRKLHVGDFLWVARKKMVTKNNQQQELVLDYIVERKRMDDLACSIKDGRFHEQKFRLKNSGIRQPIYLVEEFGKKQYFGLPEASLQQAIVNCQIVDNFLVMKTRNLKSSVNYLTIMTRYLQSIYGQKKLVSCSKEEIPTEKFSSNSFLTFAAFNSSVVKNKQLTLKEMFAKHLLQLHGLSTEKAIAIVEKYPSLAKLLKAYKQCESLVQKETLLAGIKYGKNNRNIGTVISKTICQLYCTRNFVNS